eukprot:7990350-Lingulodinium_polyedra.AAC.1
MPATDNEDSRASCGEAFSAENHRYTATWFHGRLYVGGFRLLSSYLGEARKRPQRPRRGRCPNKRP